MVRTMTRVTLTTTMRRWVLVAVSLWPLRARPCLQCKAIPLLTLLIV